VSGKWSNLDVLRSIAVLMVIVAHGLKLVWGMGPGIMRVVPIGHLGVYFFFLHTCLVLMASLERTKMPPLRQAVNFYIRRAFRIYPLSIFVVSMIVLFHIPSALILGVGSIASHQPGWGELLANLTLTQNFFYGNTLFGVLWSLPWEIQMYIVLPPLFVLLVARRRVWGVALLWAVCVAANFKFSLFFYVPHFVCGALAYLLLTSRRQREGWIPAGVLPLLLVLLSVLYCTATTTLMGYGLTMALALLLPLFRPLACRPMEWLTSRVATYSYGIYMTHLFGLWVVLRGWTGQGSALELGLRMVCFVVLTVGLAMVLYHALEKPAMEAGKAVGSLRLVEGKAKKAAA